MKFLINILWPGAGYVYLEATWFHVALAFIVPFIMFLALMFGGIGIIACGLMQIVMLADLNEKDKNLQEAQKLANMCRCSVCRELIHKDAAVCKHCGAVF